MRTPALLLCSAALALSFTSCSLSEKYAKNEAASTAYLSGSKTSPAKLNIEGLWYSPEWGIVMINQEPGGKLSGIFRDYYTVKGVVSGRKAYIVLIDDDWAEYTVQLEPKGYEELVGFYSPSVPFSDKDKQPLVLKRIDR